MNNAALSCPVYFSACVQLGRNWTPSILTVSCELVVCEKPPPLLHGVVEGDNYNYGDFVMYHCLPGFFMKVRLIRDTFSLAVDIWPHLKTMTRKKHSIRKTKANILLWPIENILVWLCK